MSINDVVKYLSLYCNLHLITGGGGGAQVKLRSPSKLKSTSRPSTSLNQNKPTKYEVLPVYGMMLTQI